MADREGAEGAQDLEAPEEELDDQQQALLHFSKYSEGRRALPWDQWTFKEKANYCVDRVFLGVLVVFLLMLLGEFGYKMWYVMNGTKIAKSVLESAVFVSDWLFAQERQEGRPEL